MLSRAFVPYRDPVSFLLQRLAELDDERRALQKTLARFTRVALPTRRPPPRPFPTVYALAVLAGLASAASAVQTARIGVRMPSGSVVYLFDGDVGTEHVTVELSQRATPITTPCARSVQ